MAGRLRFQADSPGRGVASAFEEIATATVVSLCVTDYVTRLPCFISEEKLNRIVG